MKRRLFKTSLAVALLAGMHVQSAQAYQPGVYFTEVLVDPVSSYWFVEITNLTGGSQSLSGWGFDDNSRGLVIDPDDEDWSDGIGQIFDQGSLLQLSGTLQNGQSMIITNACPDLACKNNNGQEVFSNLWSSLPGGTKVIQTSSSNYILQSGGDELNLYDPNGDLKDRLTYTASFVDEGFSAQPETPDALGQNAQSQWTPSYAGDMFGSYQSSIVGLVTAQDVGRPGFYEITAVPEPETYALMLAGLGLVGLVARKRKAANRIHA